MAQSKTGALKKKDTDYKYRISAPVIQALNIGDGEVKTNTKHVEIHFKKQLNSRDIYWSKICDLGGCFNRWEFNIGMDY